MICLPLMYTQPPALRAVESGYEVPFRCLSGYLCVRAVLGGRPLYRTNRCGAITVRLAHDGTVTVETFLPARH